MAPKIKIDTEVDTSGLKSGISTIKNLTSGNALAGLGNMMNPYLMAATAATAATIGVGKAISDTIEKADRIDEMSQKLNMTAVQFQKMEFMAGRAGLEVEAFGKIQTKLATSALEAASGNDKTAKSFQKLGIDIKNSMGELKDPNELLRETMKAIANIENPTIRTATAMELLGKNGAQLGNIFNEGAEGVDKYFKASENAVTITEDQAKQAAKLKDTIEELQMSFTKFKDEALIKTLPSLLTFVKTVEDISINLTKTEGFRTFIAWANKTGEVVANLVNFMGDITKGFAIDELNKSMDKYNAQQEYGLTLVREYNRYVDIVNKAKEEGRTADVATGKAALAEQKERIDNLKKEQDLLKEKNEAEKKRLYGTNFVPVNPEVATIGASVITPASTPKTGTKKDPVWINISDESIESIGAAIGPVPTGGLDNLQRWISSKLSGGSLAKGTSALSVAQADDIASGRDPNSLKNWYDIYDITKSITDETVKWENSSNKIVNNKIVEIDAIIANQKTMVRNSLEELNDIPLEQLLGLKEGGRDLQKEYDEKLATLKKYENARKEIINWNDKMTPDQDPIVVQALEDSMKLKAMKNHFENVMNLESKHNGSRLQYTRNFKEQLTGLVNLELADRLKTLELDSKVYKKFYEMKLIDAEQMTQMNLKNLAAERDARAEAEKTIKNIPAVVEEAKRNLLNDATMIEILFGDPDENQEAFGRHISEVAAMAQQVADVTFSLINSISAYKQLDRQKEMDDLARKHSAELDGIIVTGRRRKQIEKKQAEEMQKLQKEAKKDNAKVKIAELLTVIPINAAMAFGQAMANFAPPAGQILGGLSAAAVVANGIMGVASARKEAENFANGGIVPGRSYVGDKVPANLNSGEMILNANQQANLFNMANSKGNSRPSVQVTIQGNVDSDSRAKEIESTLYNLYSNNRLGFIGA